MAPRVLATSRYQDVVIIGTRENPELASAVFFLAPSEGATSCELAPGGRGCAKNPAKRFLLQTTIWGGGAQQQQQKSAAATAAAARQEKRDKYR